MGFGSFDFGGYLTVLKLPKIRPVSNKPIPIPVKEPLAISGNSVNWENIWDIATTKIPMDIRSNVFFFVIVFIFWSLKY